MKGIAVWSFVDAFVPVNEMGEDDERRARVLVSSSLLGGLGLTAYAQLIWHAEPVGPSFFMTSVGGAACLLLPWLVRITKSVALSGNVLTAVLFAVLAYCAARNGGFGQPATFAAGLVPFTASLTVGWRAGVPWAVVTMLGILGLDWLHSSGHVFPDLPGPATLYEHQLYGTAVVTVFLAMSAAAYEWLRQETLRGLEARSHALKAAHDGQVALSRILRLSFSEAPLEQNLHSLLDELLAITRLGAESQGAVLLVADSKALVPVATRNVDGTLLQDCASARSSGCLCGRALATGQTQFENCMESGYEPSVPDADARDAYYVVPIRLQEQTLGVIVIRTEARHRRDEHEVLFLDSAASIAASFILRAYATREKNQMQSQLF